MTSNEIKTEIIQLICRLFKDKGFHIGIIEYADLIDDMGMDSITFISIVVEIEEMFHITVPDDMLLMNIFRKVNDIVTVVEEELQKNTSEMESNTYDKA